MSTEPREGFHMERLLAMAVVGVFLAVLLWDSFQFASGEPSRTVARTFSNWAQSYPAGACFLGLIVGTILYPVGERIAGRHRAEQRQPTKQEDVIPPPPKAGSGSGSQF